MGGGAVARRGQLQASGPPLRAELRVARTRRACAKTKETARWAREKQTNQGQSCMRAREESKKAQSGPGFSRIIHSCKSSVEKACTHLLRLRSAAATRTTSEKRPRDPEAQAHARSTGSGRTRVLGRVGAACSRVLGVPTHCVGHRTSHKDALSRIRSRPFDQACGE
eukprot:6188424-Pleurochrysis_carterae.AAC.2